MPADNRWDERVPPELMQLLSDLVVLRFQQRAAKGGPLKLDPRTFELLLEQALTDAVERGALDESMRFKTRLQLTLDAAFFKDVCWKARIY